MVLKSLKTPIPYIKMEDFLGISNNNQGKNDQDSYPGPYNFRLIGYLNDRRYIGKLQLADIRAKTAFNEIRGSKVTNT